MPSSHLIFCLPLLLLPPIPPSIRVFSSESALRMRWPKYWSFSFSISSLNEQPGLISWTGWISLQSKGLSSVFSNTTVQKHQFFGIQLSLQSNSHIHRVRNAIQPSHPIIPFFSCLWSFPASRSFPMSQFFASGGQIWNFSFNNMQAYISTKTMTSTLLNLIHV